jgi:endonuclease/exonuclease/phosphatase family metal-dependent hydrolase
MRIGTWNILSGSPVTPDEHASLGAAVAQLNLDVLGLNEVDLMQERSGFVDQTREAASAMGAVDWRFGPSFRGTDDNPEFTPGLLVGPNDVTRGSHFGIALLSRIPVLRWHRLELGKSPMGLPLLAARNGERALRYCPDEPHLAIGAELANGWSVVATHLSFVTPVAVPQLLRVRRWARTMGKKVAIIGDMNLARAFIPLRPRWHSTVNASTYPSWKPTVQFDHILLPNHITARTLNFPRFGISDHLPIAVQVD